MCINNFIINNNRFQGGADAGAYTNESLLLDANGDFYGTTELDGDSQ